MQIKNALPLDALSTQFDLFLEEAHRLKERYASKISLLVGLETENITDIDLEKLEGLLQRVGSRVQYVVGSVHHVNGVPIDFDLPTYQRALASFTNKQEEEREEALFLAYFDAQYEVMRRFRPEIIGHFDLCRLYQPTCRFEKYPSVLEKIERNIRFAVEYGALFELNAAAFRKGWETAYPGEDIVKARFSREILHHFNANNLPFKIIQKQGGHFALSDDSHGPHAIGLNYDRLLPYLRKVGITKLWYLKQSPEPNAGGRYVRAVKLDGEWSNHDFWRQVSI